LSDSVEAAGPEMDWAVPIFRTVSTASGRHALRLESAFWEALKVLAQQSNRRPNDLVREIIDTTRPDNINAARAVRSTVATRLLDEQRRMAPLAAPLAVVQLMQLAPSPSFALDRQKRLVRVNDEFVRYLRTIVARASSPDSAQLTLDRHIEQLFAEIRPGAALECAMSIRVDTHERRTQVRVIVPPPAPANVLVGFVLT
jgi:predicted DNA-binding ribbon-helix-helix protein